MSHKVDQSGAVAGRDIAGGNISYTIYNEPAKSRLQVLVERLKEGIEQDPDAQNFIEGLQKWCKPGATEYTRNLEEKLLACGKERLLKDAMLAKEAFAKQLLKTAFRSATQDVYAHILGLIWGRFTHEIKPMIAADDSGKTEKAISDLANEIDQQLAMAPPDLGLGIPEIMGMLYYLTGNCHIDWD